MKLDQSKKKIKKANQAHLFFQENMPESCGWSLLQDTMKKSEGKT